MAEYFENPASIAGSAATPIISSSASGVTGGPMSYTEWIRQPEQAHFAYSPWGSQEAYKNYLLEAYASGQTNAANYNGYDVTGYSQAGWDLEQTRNLLAEQRAYNSAEAEKNRQWQERMSNTAYQRAVQDLEAAGLNKWLAVTGGNGASASTPSGSSASSSSGDASTPNPTLYKAIIQGLFSLFSSALKII